MNRDVTVRAGEGKDHQAAAGPLALRRLLRNSAIPESHFLADAQPAPAVDTTELRRKHRRHLSDDLARRRRAAFLEEVRSSPETLYDRLMSYKGGLDMGKPIAEVAVHHRLNLIGLLAGGVGEDFTINPPPAGQGEMWWGETSFALPNRIGMDGVFNETGLLLFGGLDWDDGDLYQSSFHIHSSFYLAPERMPDADHVRSSPGGVLAGQMFGGTGGSASLILGGFADGDHWSKCTLRLQQRAMAIDPNNPADAIPAAPTAFAEVGIINIDGTNEWAEGSLPGGLGYPSLDLHLIKERILRIDLDIDLFIQLEGDALIRFGGVGHGNPAFHQWSQWKLQPL